MASKRAALLGGTACKKTRNFARERYAPVPKSKQAHNTSARIVEIEGPPCVVLAEVDVLTSGRRSRQATCSRLMWPKMHNQLTPVRPLVCCRTSETACLCSNTPSEDACPSTLPSVTLSASNIGHQARQRKLDSLPSMLLVVMYALFDEANRSSTRWAV
jgi:hypothetical protein